ncbi:MAG: hypothetical protein RBG1_1C00001G0557 [candidate division Zixibacteria bacterium RBG-1]|nr:MAG: hypothetical protein RBG1_1C00001G0557 [candidate division Zixibacteria bacterium RBG-1]
MDDSIETLKFVDPACFNLESYECSNGLFADYTATTTEPEVQPTLIWLQACIGIPLAYFFYRFFARIDFPILSREYVQPLRA